MSAGGRDEDVLQVDISVPEEAPERVGNAIYRAHITLGGSRGLLTYIGVGSSRPSAYYVLGNFFIPVSHLQVCKFPRSCPFPGFEATETLYAIYPGELRTLDLPTWEGMPEG